VVRVDYNHILSVAHDAVAVHIEFTDQVYIMILVAWAVVPRFS
jgi:hypothetical protein